MSQHLSQDLNETRAERPSESLEWMDRGSEFFEGQLASLGDDQLLEASGLPGWTRLHVVSHMARNARGLMNLVRWAETGVETPMYPSPEHRRDDIEAGARQPPAEVRADALDAARRLREALETMPDAPWSARVRTTLGLDVRATEIPWMRVREVWVHAVDLRAGATFDDLDEPVAAAVVEEAAVRFARRDDCPAVLLVSPASGRRYAIGPAAENALVVSGSTQALAGWLLGRGAGQELSADSPLPALPAWM